MNEIIAAIVGAAVTAIIALIAYLYTSRRGNRISVKRISETPQIKISEEVRKNLKITYNDQPVDNLVLNTLVIYNNGNEIIEPVEIILGVKSSNGEIVYLEGEEDDPLGHTKIVRGGPEFVIDRPYLNPRKKFKEEEIKLAVFSNESLDFYVEGGGKGWYAKFEDEREKAIEAFTTGVAVGITLLVVLLVFIPETRLETSAILLGFASAGLVSIIAFRYLSKR